MLIENRGIPPEEKLYYLKQYVTGPAKEAVSGFFFCATEEAYNGAWTTLRERYGHPFKIQQAFRDRLNKWPRIGRAKDAPALQKFADFIRNCHDAMPYVEGLQVLNDCLENQKLLNKLPEWLASWWNRVVTDSLEGCRIPNLPRVRGIRIQGSSDRQQSHFVFGRTERPRNIFKGRVKSQR